MRDFRNDTWDIFNQIIKEKEIIIFGASAAAKSLLDNIKKLDSNWRVKGVVDNDKNRWGNDFGGYVIEKPDTILT